MRKRAPPTSTPRRGRSRRVQRIVAAIRERFPTTPILFRADSGFCREPIMAWCERNDVHYLLGLAKNDRLLREIADELAQAKGRFEETGKPARVFKEFRYSTLDSWSGERRVIAKAEHLDKGSNPRFVVTSLPSDEFPAQATYEETYCARGGHGEPHQGTAARPLRRSHQPPPPCGPTNSPVVLLGGLRVDDRLAATGTPRDGTGPSPV